MGIQRAILDRKVLKSFSTRVGGFYEYENCRIAILSHLNTSDHENVLLELYLMLQTPCYSSTLPYSLLPIFETSMTLLNEDGAPDGMEVVMGHKNHIVKWKEEDSKCFTNGLNKAIPWRGRKGFTRFPKGDWWVVCSTDCFSLIKTGTEVLPIVDDFFFPVEWMNAFSGRGVCLQAFSACVSGIDRPTEYNRPPLRPETVCVHGVLPDGTILESTAVSVVHSPKIFEIIEEADNEFCGDTRSFCLRDFRDIGINLFAESNLVFIPIDDFHSNQDKT